MEPPVNWSHEETQALIAVWSEEKIQRDLEESFRNEKVYREVSGRLAAMGMGRSAKQCREKIKKLKQEYRRIKTHGEGSGAVTLKAFRWYDAMDAIMGERRQSDAMISEVMISDVETDLMDTPHPTPAPSPCPTENPQDPQIYSIQLEDVDGPSTSTAVTSTAVQTSVKDETQWLPDEVQVLMTLWAQPNIQKQLLTTAANSQVFTYLSNELALVGFNKTPLQCSVKVNNLKGEYRRVKELKLQSEVKSDWFAILDSVLGLDGEDSTGVGSSAALTQSETPEDEHENDTLQAVWTSDEVKVLLTRWAEESVQEQLRSTQRNERVFAQLSSELATQGFDKTTSQCRSKIRLLKQKYKRLKEQKVSNKQKSRWFVIMDEVLSRHKPEAETRPLQTSQHERSETDSGCSLSLSSLCLLVPTLRLMCAFAWSVVQCCDVAQYRKVEELVRLVTELVPELLTPRETVQLLLRLRASLVLELCRNESTANLLSIQPHLKIIQDLTMGSTCDQELEKSKSNFVEVVESLLQDPEERAMFFKEVFPIHYGRQHEATLSTLVWKFISRLDALLPIPDIKQTAEWLSSAPSVMEECGQLVLEPDQLKALMSFQQSGNTKKGCSQAQNMFLPRLSLPPKANSTQLTSEQQEMSPGDEDEGQFDCPEDKETVEEKQTDCSRGNEQTSDMTNLNVHTTLGLQTCSLCPYSDSQASGLLQHIRKELLTQEHSHLPSRAPGEDSALQQVDPETCSWSTTNACEYCGKVFKDASMLNSHIKTHTRPFHCDKCEKKYSSRASLKVHRRIHTGETPYLCSHCGRGFRSSYNLGLHVRIHTGERRYRCQICGKASIQHLARHMRMHRGEKNYLCTECGKAFLSSGELRLHMRLHTGERPHTCKHCGRGFTAKCLLTVHMRQHTGESPYRCSVCPKSFPTLKAQKRHTAIHSNKKSHQCLKCGKIFRQEDTFKMHAQTHT
uniref:C2H2-type domain-containing protein n=1 Tax=Lates calcarifer TaxID=8187 RepID=A0A4W6BJ33_LATCA